MGGYLNGLTRYVTSLSVSYPTHKFFYHNKGSIPETNISAASATGYAILSKDIQNFSATSSAAFIYTRSLFYYADPVNSLATVSWFVHNTTGRHALQNLPAEIVANHPILDITNMKHESTSFYLESLPYEKVILSELQNESYISRGITIY